MKVNIINVAAYVLTYSGKMFASERYFVSIRYVFYFLFLCMKTRRSLIKN